jgi:hypothetical protein
MNDKELSPEAQVAKREYFRKWRAANKDKVAAQNKRYWEKRAAKQIDNTDNTYKSDKFVVEK